MRCDQLMGLTDKATKFLEENIAAPEVCFHCKRSFPREITGYFTGMSGNNYPLYKYPLINPQGQPRFAEEFVQASPPGPVVFIELKVFGSFSVLTFKWTDKEIEELT